MKKAISKEEIEKHFDAFFRILPPSKKEIVLFAERIMLADRFNQMYDTPKETKTD